MTAGRELAPGDLVGRYEIVREIGRGGMCRVYAAVHRDLQKAVAVKTLNAEFLDRPDVVERFVREGRAASRIRHRHVVDVVDVGEQDGVVYLAMEFLEGEDLSQRIKRGGPLAPREAADLMLPVLAAIAEAHRAGVVHRDLKPGNIFLCVDRRGAVEPKVLDFGISKLRDDVGEHRTSTEAMLGTPAYMAPEQIERSRDVTAATDVYALGVILYQCLTGKLPFRGGNVYETLNLVLLGSFAPPLALRPELPPALDAAVLRAMARAPAGRFESVDAMGAALLPFASDLARAQWAPVFGEAPAAAPVSVAAGYVSASHGAPGTITTTARARDILVATERPPRRGLHAAAALLALAGVVAVAAWSLSREAVTVAAPRAPAAPVASAPTSPEAPAPDASFVAVDAPTIAPAVTSRPPRLTTRRGVGRARPPSTERAPSGSLIVR